MATRNACASHDLYPDRGAASQCARSAEDSRDDILAHAYAQCRPNKGAPAIDGQDFADIEANRPRNRGVEPEIIGRGAIASTDPPSSMRITIAAE